MRGVAQRFALLALGRAWILFESRKNPKPEKCSKMLQNPQRPVHALLARLGLSNTYPSMNVVISDYKRS